MYTRNVTVRGALIALMSLGSLWLGGCTGLPGNFRCHATATDTCQTLPQVNRAVDHGTLPGRDVEPMHAAKSSTTRTHATPDFTAWPQATPKAGERVRGGEVVQRIWIGPWQDTAGNYHEPAYLYTVLRPSHWIGPPVEAVNPNLEED